MKKLIAGAVLAAGLLVAGSAAAQPIVLVFADGVNMVGMDVEALTQDGDVARGSFIWVNGRPDDSMDGRLVGHTEIRQEFDCKKNLSRVTFMGVYDIAGQEIEAREESNAWKPIAPNSGGWAWRQTVCDADYRRRLASFSVTRSEFVTASRKSLQQMQKDRP